MKTKSLLPVLCMLFCLACKKEDPLPKATEKGANTVGCKVNGKNWVADAGGSFSGQKYALLLDSDDQFVLSCYQVGGEKNSTIQIGIEKLTATGTYYLNEQTIPYPGATFIKNFGSYDLFKPQPSKSYLTNPTHSGYIIITRFDKPNRIISGTFEFTAEELNGSGETVKVTDGRFDIQY